MACREKIIDVDYAIDDQFADEALLTSILKRTVSAKLGVRMGTKDLRIKVALIGAAAIVIAALISTILQPSWWRSSSPSVESNFVVAGTIVDQSTNRAVGQALISIVGRSETYVTEDNGNFRISLQSVLPRDGIVRIHVSKPGYAPYDGTTTQTETLIVPLKR
jgi:hypothetical protein